MANRLYDAYFRQEKGHEVGVLNTLWAKSYVNGAILTGGNIDNYLLVELDGYDSDGNVKCKPLTDNTKQGFLVATNEEESLFGDGLLQGNYTDFYNAVGDMVRIIIPEKFIRHETSAFAKANTNESIEYGQKVHYDAKTKKYLVSNDGTEHADYEAAANKYEVVGIDTDFGQNVGTTTIRIMSI